MSSFDFDRKNILTYSKEYLFKEYTRYFNKCINFIRDHESIPIVPYENIHNDWSKFINQPHIFHCTILGIEYGIFRNATFPRIARKLVILSSCSFEI